MSKKREFIFSIKIKAAFVEVILPFIENLP
jgi:hypothetical protein